MKSNSADWLLHLNPVFLIISIEDGPNPVVESIYSKQSAEIIRNDQASGLGNLRTKDKF